MHTYTDIYTYTYICTFILVVVYLERVLTLGNLGDLMLSTLAQNAINVGSIPALGTIFLIFITSMTY